ncbi:ABC transporter, phosphonate, periplasmic substrate-binding protein [bacterium BMS3Abin07]|nr:ABC transporter, phosphonate, periplasmic substrate-binding protein [bacterium BMS3Abin07]GBE31228.1 ABC transporter, phosphonate, periplasmic substrate-binding protein [bacterium BMS3Bbin05]HDO23505.1 hypothetical protein [Nitrospirota bacterium]HDZ88974.1 hypothetical protein [Nitrospirota bacterium]
MKRCLILKICLAFLLIVGCLNTNTVLAKDVIKMAIFPRRPALVTERMFSPLAQYLSSKIGEKVELVVSKNFRTFWGGVKKGEYDIVHYNQYHYVKSHKEFGYNVFVKNEEFGSAEINAAIVVRKDSGINTISDLKGKKIVFGGGRMAMQSYIGATHILITNGLKKGDYIESFAINPPSSVFAVFNKMADAGGVGEIVLTLPIVKKRIDVNQIKVLASGEKLPMLCWGVKKGMDKKLIAKIQKAMIELKNNKKGRKILKSAGVTAFLPATDKEYDPVRRVVKEVLNEDYY